MNKDSCSPGLEQVQYKIIKISQLLTQIIMLHNLYLIITRNNCNKKAIQIFQMWILLNTWKLFLNCLNKLKINNHNNNNYHNIGFYKNIRIIIFLIIDSKNKGKITRIIVIIVVKSQEVTITNHCQFLKIKL